MQLSMPSPTTLSEAFVSNASSSVAPRPQLKMLWHKEWDGKRERMVARWVID